MIPKKEIDKAIGIAKEFGIGKLYLFGSSLYKSPAWNRQESALAALTPLVIIVFATLTSILFYSFL